MSRVSHLLNTTVEIWRVTRTDDGGGGWEESWSLLSTVRARASQPSASDRAYRAGQDSAALSWVLYMEPGTDVRLDDEIHLRNTVLKVATVYEPSELNTYLRVDCTTHQTNPGGGS